MSSIGEMLRSERLRRGWSIESIADYTKISSRHLEAIEADELDRLPGGFFTRSFVRQYARALGLDEHEFDSELDEVAEPAPPPFPTESSRREAVLAPVAPDVRFRPYTERRSLGSIAGFVVVVLACSGLYTLWQRSRQAPPAQVPVAAIPADSAADARVMPHPAAADAVSVPRAVEPQVAPAQPAGRHTVPGAPAASSPESAVSRDASAGDGPMPAGGPIRVELGATAATWIRVTSDSKVVFTGTLKAGETKSFHGMASLSVRTGNAGGLQASWNGRPVGAIGPLGQIRVVEFTPEGHTIRQASLSPVVRDIY
jgi:cytoskeleton protein RodZ